MVKIAFGSCYTSRFNNAEIFDRITQEEADLFVWLGDVAYLDKDRLFSGLTAEESLNTTKKDTYY